MCPYYRGVLVSEGVTYSQSSMQLDPSTCVLYIDFPLNEMAVIVKLTTL